MPCGALRRPVRAGDYNRAMYIVAIGWLYVTLLMAASETTVVAGVMTFLLYGAGPLALLLWLFGTPQRRRHRLRQKMIDQPVSEDDGGDTRADQ
jgi:hypothetical protein